MATSQADMAYCTCSNTVAGAAERQAPPRLTGRHVLDVDAGPACRKPRARSNLPAPAQTDRIGLDHPPHLTSPVDAGHHPTHKGGQRRQGGIASASPSGLRANPPARPPLGSGSLPPAPIRASARARLAPSWCPCPDGFSRNQTRQSSPPVRHRKCTRGACQFSQNTDAIGLSSSIPVGNSSDTHGRVAGRVA